MSVDIVIDKVPNARCLYGFTDYIAIPCIAFSLFLQMCTGRNQLSWHICEIGYRYKSHQRT